MDAPVAPESFTAFGAVPIASGRAGVRRGWRVCALAAVVVLLMAVGGATRAAASGLSIGANSTVKLGDVLLDLGCNDLLLEPGGTLAAQASTIRLGGTFSNQGTFDPGTGTVVFEPGCGATPTHTPTSTPTGTATATPTGIPMRAIGQPCTMPGQCQSMNCVDGVCCDMACTQADHACNLPGREGTCLSTTAAPAPAVSGMGTVLAIAMLLLVAGARLALRRGSRESGVIR
jgi:hypothetical protein